MGIINWPAVGVGALAFFLVGALWYGVLFGKAWQREAGLTDERLRGSRMPLLFGLCFVLELVIAWMLAHLIARTSPAPYVVMMFAFGFGAFLMTPAIGINYLYQRKSFKLFAIDAGHLIVGMVAMGGVFVLLG
jgi:hypothetical protein